MNLADKQLLHNLIREQSEFNKNDLLVSIEIDNTLDFNPILPLEKLSKILSISQNSSKESGIDPFCQAVGLVTWNWNNTTINTPIWLIPCSYVVDKVRGQVQLTPEVENGFINPFLQKKINEIYNLQLKETSFELFVEQLQAAGFEQLDKSFSVVGNFHHHRYTILKELQDLSELNHFSSPLNQLLSGEKGERKKIKLAEESILPYDTDHRAIFELFENENCVVQGPPGTGKSQLLTNIIGKSTLSGYSTVFVSEKKAALEVVKKRLASCGLEHISVLATDDLITNSFIQEIKKSWEYIDGLTIDNKIEISTRKEIENNLQFSLDILNQPELIGGISFTAYNDLKERLLKSINVKGSSNNEYFSNKHFLQNPPSLIDFEKSLTVVQRLYKENCSTSCSIIPYQIYQNGHLAQLLEKITETLEQIEILEQIIPDLTVNDIDKLQYQVVIYQLFQNELAKKYVNIIAPDSKEQKKFLKLYKKHKQIQKQVEQLSAIHSDWKIIPSDLNLKQLSELSDYNSFFKRRQFKKRWNQFSYLSVSDAKIAIDQLIQYKTHESELYEIEQKLAELGVFDLSEIAILKSSLHLFSKEKWDTYHSLSNEKRQVLTELDTKINWIKTDLKTNYRFINKLSITSQLNKLKRDLPKLIILENELKTINQSVLETISICETYEEYVESVISTHHIIFQSHYPSLSSFSSLELKNKIESLIKAENKENELMAAKITRKIKNDFDQYNTLINTPTAKLSEEEKLLKKKLKVGKSILIKEFSKTRQHPTLRELVKTEAFYWIRVLKPVWLTNPTRLAKLFPLEIELFDVCIMDEASQMPLQNGFGALLRSKYAIIAGDEQQMNPTSYFKSGTNDVVSMLHHASFYFPMKTLTHHYRSKQSPLISFSNSNFYDNKLVVYPSFPIDEKCVKRHFCEEGKFINRRNEQEAERVVEIIKAYIQSDKTIGVVAFSQEQVDVIWKKLPDKMVQEIQNRIEQNSFFIKPLEKVQGDECEHLIISLAYAPDENDRFTMHFGPLNLETGRNRLNVLFSRASETIDFVCSIQSTLIQWSDNESIQLLYRWLSGIEHDNLTHSSVFPLCIQPIIEKNKLLIKNGYALITNALELKTTYSVLTKRGWEIVF